MIKSVHDVKKTAKTDYNKKSVYDFDYQLSKFINQKFNGKSFCLEEYALKLREDFGLTKTSTNINKSDTNSSYYEDGCIYLERYALEKKCIETFFHEYSHFFCEIFFKEVLPHGGEFLSVFKFLLNKYDLVTNEEFDRLILENEHIKTVLFNDYIHSFEEYDADDFDLLERQNVSSGIYTLQSKNGNFIISKKMIAGCIKTVYETDKQYHHFIKTSKENKNFHIVINKCFYQYENIFSQHSDVDLFNLVLFSPIYNDKKSETCLNYLYASDVIPSHSNVEYHFKNKTLKEKNKDLLRKKRLQLRQDLKDSFYDVITTSSISRYEQLSKQLFKEIKTRYFLKESRSQLKYNLV